MSVLNSTEYNYKHTVFIYVPILSRDQIFSSSMSNYSVMSNLTQVLLSVSVSILMNMAGQRKLHILVGLTTLVLAAAVTAQESVSNPNSQNISITDSEQEFKCLTCEKSNELMCYNNM